MVLVQHDPCQGGTNTLPGQRATEENTHMLATEYAEYFEIDPQEDGERDADFCIRVSDTLSAQRRFLESHEVYLDLKLNTTDEAPND